MEAVYEELLVRKIKLEDIKRYMDVGFCDDHDLVKRYHFSESTIEETVLKNIKNVEELAAVKPLVYYGIYLEETPIGFTVMGENLLYSFAINIHCRRKEIVLAWIEWVKKHLDNNFVVCLHSENTRARNFFFRNGLEVFIEDDGKNICLITKK